MNCPVNVLKSMAQRQDNLQMKMDDSGVTNTSSIMNYFQREKSPAITDTDAMTKDKETAESLLSTEPTFKKDKKGRSKSAEANDKETVECIRTVKQRKASCPIGENKDDDITTVVKSDCSVNTKCSVDNGEKSIAKLSVATGGCSKREDQNEKKTKWNFSWKGKIKKTKEVDVCHDSDSDFETNNESTDINSKSYNQDKRVGDTKSRKKKAAKLQERTTKLRTNVALLNRSNKTSDTTNTDSETKTCSKFSDLASISTSKLEPSSPRDSENDSVSIENVTESSSNDRVSKNFDGEISEVNLESCNKIEAEGSCQNTIVSPLSRTRESKSVLKNDSVFVQSFAEDSNDKNTTKNVGYNSGKASLEKCGDKNSEERTNDKETIKVKEDVKTETPYKSSDTSKSGSESPKKSYFDVLMQSSKAKVFEQQVSCEIGGQVRQDKSDYNCREKTEKRMENLFKNNDKKRKTSKTRRKKIRNCEENASETDGNESAKNEKKENTTRRSARKTRSKNFSETICESNLKEEVDIQCSGAKVENKSLIRTRRSRTLTSTKKQSVEESLVAISEKNMEKGKLLRREQEDLQLINTEGDSESKVADSSQSCHEIKDVSGDFASSNRNKRGKRLRKSCILDSDDEQSTESPKETKPSVLKTAKMDNRPKKVSGPIAPIFLPGAWRRAKEKLEEVEKLETATNVVEVPDDSRALQASDLLKQDDNNPSNVNLSDDYIPNNKSALSTAAFFSMFEKAVPKPVSIVVQLIEAPFPKVSHVQQQNDDGKDAKWKLPMVRNRFVKEEYFFEPHFHSDITDRNLSWLTKMSVCSSGNATTVDSKHIQLKVPLVIEKSQKQKIISHLKTIYQGVPLIKLFKRCLHQLLLCEKSLKESEIGARLVISKEFKKSPATFVEEKTVISMSQHSTSAQAFQKNESFTKISRKTSTREVQGKAKTKQKSPLLLAFQKNENASNLKKQGVVVQTQSKKKESVVKTQSKKNESARKARLKKKESVLETNSKKDKVKKTSIMDFMGVQAKRSENIREDNLSGRSQKGKNTCGKVTLAADDLDGVEKKLSACKKRTRRNEDEATNECAAEENAVSTAKKVKLLSDTQEFKKPTKGRKRKVRSMEGKDRKDVVEINENKSEPLEKSAKCRKISSDDDFIQPPSRRSRVKSNANTAVNDDAAKDCGTEATCLRKSRRLQEKYVAEEIEKQVEVKPADVETSDGNKDSDAVEVNADKNDCVEVGDEVQINEEDAKVFGDSTPVSEVVTKCTQQVGEIKVACNEKDANAETCSVLSSVLWSECFKPRNSSEIVGNSNSGVRLKNWLSEWKTLRERKLEALKRHEEKKKQRVAAKKGGKELSSKWWYDDDDSDFCSSDDSSDDSFCDEDNVCNTMLLSGPVGCGKTSAVYACAEELGFKVIEVNSSTKRGGKYILSELQEATQSHQVSTKRNLLQGGSSLFPPANAGDPSEKKDEMKLGVKKNKKVSKKGPPNKKERLSKEPQLQGPMSLILLDEVDVLFEEDKGFWVSVNTLRQNSKRPIVMTASDPNTVDIDGQFEHILLKSPSLKLYSAYLQTICLTKNVFVNPSDMRALSWLHHADIRRFLLSLQFWVDSNAGACDKHGLTVRNDLGSNTNSLSDNERVSALSTDCRPVDDQSITLVEPDKHSELLKNCPIDTLKNCEDVNIHPVGVKDYCREPNPFINGKDDKTSTTDFQQLARKELGSTLENEEGSECVNHSCSSGNNLPNHELIDEQKVVMGKNKPTNLSEVNIEFSNQDSSEQPMKELLTSEKCAQLKPCDTTHALDEQYSCQKLINEPVRIEKNEKVSLENTTIEMHEFCFESLLGLRNLNSHAGGVLETLKSQESFQQKCTVTSHCQGLNLDIVYCNLETLFPRVFGSVDTINDSIMKTHPSKRGDHSSPEIEKESAVCELTFSESQNYEPEMRKETTTNNESKIVDKTKIHEKDLISKKIAGLSLKSLASFYEDMSFMDSELCCDGTEMSEMRLESWCSAKISPGLKDSVGKHSPCKTTWTARNCKNELRGALEVASLEHSHKLFHKSLSGSHFNEDAAIVDLDSTCSRSDSKLQTKCADKSVTDIKILASAPDAKCCLQVATCAEKSSSTRKPLQDFLSVSPHLPELNYLSRSSIILDYLPTLHTICNIESLRKAARVKRRFYHYLDSIGFHIPPTAVQSLTENSYFN